MSRRSLKTGVAAGVLLAAVATAGAAAADMSSRSPTPAPSPTETPSGTWNCPGMGEMRPITGESDYLSQMVPHHEEAVTAARQLERSDRPEMQRLGRSIVETQSAEIEKMKGWLAQWYPSSSTPTPASTMMRDLSGLSGEELDKAFLQDMLPHHMVAIMMSQQLLMSGQAQHSEVADFARSVRDGQHDEAMQMRQWLVQWYGPGSMPCVPNMRGMPGMPGMPSPTGSEPSPTGS
ncbi:DUF305 domain-containing protein [Nonomuraea muscovyensis]|uniref:DUF305 domain-containing protein n=1 Tax=Nonomuraea muscovyensis TaxID=1124761 RepID=UPI0033E726C1